MIPLSGTYTDQYQLAMAQAYFLKGQQHNLSIFDYFFRKLPFSGGYAIFAGLDDLLTTLENLRFNALDIDYLRKQGMQQQFLNYLKEFRFLGDVYACREGEIVFPTCPIVRIEANIIEAQLIESLLLNILNFQTLIATKACRIRHVAGKRKLIEFGLRRAQGLSSFYATRASIIGGFEATSHVQAGRDYQIPVSGTMAHSFIQSYDDELTAFRDFVEVWPEHCILLVDTYNTLKVGVPNAIIVAKEMEQRGQRLAGVRLDSGDLAYLSKKTRHMLNEAGLNYVKIVVSNQLDEYVIKTLVEQEAPIDTFGVGTNLVIGHPDAALDGVYKLAYFKQKSRIKLSESTSKVTLPNKKQVYRILDKHGSFWGADVVALHQEKTFSLMHHPFDPAQSLEIKHYQKEPLLEKVMEKGKRLHKAKTLQEISTYSQQRLALLPDEYKRFIKPHQYKVGLSQLLFSERNQLIQDHLAK